MSKVDWSKACGDATHALCNVDGDIEFSRFDGERHHDVEDDEVWFIISDECWRVIASRPTPNDIDTTITQRGERYGKFKDGSVIMQDLKNIMRETPNWEGLTPSQREALEMIQHKIGRILNGDPMYDDNWMDICGYSQLILDELNGAVR